MLLNIFCLKIITSVLKTASNFQVQYQANVLGMRTKQ